MLFPGIFVESALQSTRADEEKEVRAQLDEMFKQLDSRLCLCVCGTLSLGSRCRVFVSLGDKFDS